MLIIREDIVAALLYAMYEIHTYRNTGAEFLFLECAFFALKENVTYNNYEASVATVQVLEASSRRT